MILRIIRACREMGISTVAIYSEADKDSLHVQLADESYCVGGNRVADSYLNMPAILTVAVESGAQAIHPGYGLLSENAKFVSLCEQCNINFIGPSSEMIKLLGDKDNARKTMRAAGVPVTPGCDIVESVEQAKEEAETVIEENKEETAEEIKKDAEEGKEPEKTTVYYVTDEVQQSQYINMFKEEGQDALILKHNIDSAFISHVEQKKETVKFMRIDADINESVKADGEENLEDQTKELGEIFKKALGKENLTVKAEKLKNESVSSMMTVTEESRRMQEMMKMYNMYGMDSSMFGGQETLVLNLNNKLVQYVLANKEGDLTKLVCEQLYDLAVITHRQLTPEEMTKFVARSNEIMMLLAK